MGCHLWMAGEFYESRLLKKLKKLGALKKPSYPLKDIVKAKYVACLECGNKLITLRTHLRNGHGLLPKEYFQRFSLNPQKYPLVCREYSKPRSAMAKI